MSTRSQTATRVFLPKTGKLFSRLIGAAMAWEDQWRQRQKLRRQAPERLKDMGISPAQANAEFRDAGSGHPTGMAPVRTTALW